MARLRVETGKSTGKTADFEKTAVIGRGETAQLQINDIKASREHCKVFDQGGQWVVADLNSRNGIKVNGVQTTRKNLSAGDQIEIGETKVVFEIAAGAPRAAAAEPASSSGVEEIELEDPAETADRPAVANRPAVGDRPAVGPARAPAPAPSAASSKKEAAMAQARAASAKDKAKDAGKKAASAPAGKGGTATKDAGGLQVSDRVLQFHKVDAKNAGLLDVDLGQSSGIVQILWVLGGIVFLVIVVWAISVMLG